VINTNEKKSGLKEIAEAVGCSKSAVSAVLNQSKSTVNVSAATRARIEAAAKRLGYKPDYHAQVLAKGRASVVGLVLDDTSRLMAEGYFWAQFIAGVEDRVRRAGNDLLLIGPTSGETDLERGIRHMQRRQVDALIVPWLMYKNQLQALEKLEGPIVFAYAFEDIPFPIVSDNARPGVHAAVRHLAGLGHKRILWVGLEQNGQPQWPIRRDSFREGCREVAATGLEWAITEQPEEKFSTIENLTESARKQFAAFLPRAEPFTAIVAYNELIAIGISQALHDT
jgi:DNA-binding LacI/PurR family transcriptional regulator